MALNLQSISTSATIKSPRTVLLGVEKIGKTTFASQHPSPIFIPITGETGLDYLEAARFPAAQTHADVMEALRVLYHEDHPYKTVVIDSASAIEPLIFDATCKEHGVASIEKVGGGYGKGYVEALKYWRELCTALDFLRDDKGIGCVLIGHVKCKEFNDPESDPYTCYWWDVDTRAANLVYRWCDVLLFANYKRAIVSKSDAGFNKQVARATSTGQRCLYTQKRPAHPGGGRGVYGQLPYEIPLGYSEWQKAIASAK